MTHEDLDKLFQQNSEEHGFKYNEEAWSQMDGLLEEEDKKRRRFFFLLFFFGILVISFGTLMIFNSSTKSSDSYQEAKKIESSNQIIASDKIDVQNNDNTLSNNKSNLTDLAENKISNSDDSKEEKKTPLSNSNS